MLFGLMDLLFSDPYLFPIVMATMALALLAAVTIHEFSHALVANGMGDPTAANLGRLTLNPLKHLDPLGTIMLLVVGFGWGKPVPVNPNSLRPGPRQGMALVSLAGPASNFLLAAVLGLLVRGRLLAWHPSPYAVLTPQSLAADLVGMLIVYNVLLGVFNLIPLAPLDGFKVALGVLPRALANSFARLEQYGPMLLLGLVALDSFTRTGILWRIMGPAMNLAISVTVGR